MAIRDRAAQGYFRVEQRLGEVWGLILAATEGGTPEWVYRLEPRDQDVKDLVRNLVKFLDVELVRNVEPVCDVSVLRASDQLELGYSVQEAILEAVTKAAAPEITWQDVVDRIDRMQNQLDYLRHIAETGHLQWPDREIRG